MAAKAVAAPLEFRELVREGRFPGIAQCRRRHTCAIPGETGGQCCTGLEYWDVECA